MVNIDITKHRWSRNMELLFPILFLACRNSFRLHIHWKLRSRLKFLSIFWERERGRDTRIAQACSTGEFIDSTRYSNRLWHGNSRGISYFSVKYSDTGNTSECSRFWGRYRRWMVRNDGCDTRNTYVTCSRNMVQVSCRECACINFLLLDRM